MSENRLQIPDGMTVAAHNAPGLENDGNKYYYISKGLEAALRWWKENPSMPTDEQLDTMKRDLRFRDGVDFDLQKLCAEWQRRAFLAPEPEVPDAILALICREDETPPCRKVYNERILEAYRRGQKAGK